MNIKRTIFALALAILVLSAFETIPLANASDELFLSGVVRSIDSLSSTVTVDVKSQGCKGVRNFEADDVSVFEHRLGKTVSFFIDSSTCRDGEVYTIIKTAFPKGGRR